MSQKALLQTYYNFKLHHPKGYIYHITVDPKEHNLSRKRVYELLYEYWLESPASYMAVINETAPETGMEHFHGFLGFAAGKYIKAETDNHISNSQLTVLFARGGVQGWARYCTKGKRKLNHYTSYRSRYYKSSEVKYNPYFGNVKTTEKETKGFRKN